MYCLLCHEKIPRLRAWTTKSEFCSDEHAALYKRQTLERLLTSEPEAVSPAAPLQAAAAGSAPAKPAQAEPPLQQEVSKEAVLVSGATDRGRRRPAAPQPSGEEVDQLWKLADEVGQPQGESGLNGNPSAPAPQVPRQSAEEALQALRALAGDGHDAPQDGLEDFLSLHELDEDETAALKLPPDFDFESGESIGDEPDDLSAIDPPELVAADLLERELPAEDLEAPGTEIDGLPVKAADSVDLDAPEAPEPEQLVRAAQESADLDEDGKSSRELHDLRHALAQAAGPDLEAPPLELEPEIDLSQAADDMPAPELEWLDDADGDAANAVVEAAVRAKVLQFPDHPDEEDEAENGSGPPADAKKAPKSGAPAGRSRKGGRAVRFRPSAALLALQPQPVEAGAATESTAASDGIGQATALPPAPLRPFAAALSEERRIRTGGRFEAQFETLVDAAWVAPQGELQALPETDSEVLPPAAKPPSMSAIETAFEAPRALRPRISDPSGSLLQDQPLRAREPEAFSIEYLQAAPEEILEPRDALIRAPRSDSGGFGDGSADDEAQLNAPDRLEAVDGY